MKPAAGSEPGQTQTSFDVFLSYSHADSETAGRIRNALQARGFAVWIDKDQIRPGDWFAEALERGVRSCKAVVILISSHSAASSWVREEYYRALTLCHEHGIRLIPVICDGSEPPDFLSGRQSVDCRDPAQFETSIGEIVWGISGDRPAVPGRIARSFGSPLLSDRRRTTSWIVLATVSLIVALAIRAVFDSLDETRAAPFRLNDFFIVLAAVFLALVGIRYLVFRITRRMRKRDLKNE